MATDEMYLIFRRVYYVVNAHVIFKPDFACHMLCNHGVQLLTRCVM